METKIKSVLYTRVSTTKEGQQTSWEQQQKFKDKRFEIEKVFDDRASGTSLKKRTGLIELLNYIGVMIEFTKDDYVFTINHTTDIKVIIVSSTSRLARNVVDAKRIIDICHRKNVRIYFIDINSYSDNEQIEILLNIYFTLDAQYSKELSRKVKHGMDRLGKEGYIFCGGNIKGFTVKDGKLLKNEESEIIYNIFYDYIYNNYSLRDLEKKYNSSTRAMSLIINNKKYCGFNKKDDLEKHPNIEAIISLEMWQKAQEIRNSRLNGKRGVNRNTYALSAKCICPLCGLKLACKKSYQGKRINSWQCYNSDCKKTSITESRINEYLLEMIKSNQWKEFIKFKLKNQLDNIHLIDIEALKMKIDDIDKQLKDLVKMKLIGKIEEDHYNSFYDELQEQKNNLLERLEGAENIQAYKSNLEALEHEYISKLDHIENLIDNENFEEVHQLIKNIYFNYTYDTKVGQNILNIDKSKKKLFISKITWKDFDILDNFEE